MNKIALSVALVFLTFAAFADPKSDVRCQEIAFSQSVENNDIEAFKSFLDDDARFVGNSVVRGPDEISTAWAIFFSDDGPAIMWRPQIVEVLEEGTLALSRGPYRMTSKDPDGNPVEHWGTFNSVWRKNSEGKWRVVFDAGNVAAAAPDEETQALLLEEDAC